MIESGLRLDFPIYGHFVEDFLATTDDQVRKVTHYSLVNQIPERSYTLCFSFIVSFGRKRGVSIQEEKTQ